MKIRKIEIKDNPIIGNLSLDFTDGNGNTIDTIILAGENGVGKSYILNSIYCISNSNIDNNKRDEKRYYEIEIEKAVELTSLKSSSAYFDVTDPMEIKELEQKIEEAIDELPKACRTIFLLNRKQGLKYKEIADKLNLSVNTVEVQMGRALKKLKVSLSEYLFVLFFCKTGK